MQDVELQRVREVDLHEKRIIKLMNVIETLSTVGDSKTDLRVLAEKMNRVREVRRTRARRSQRYTPLPRLA